MAKTSYRKKTSQRTKQSTVKNVKPTRMGDIDYTFLFIVILLLSFGLVMLLSASAPAGNTLHNNSYWFFNKQLLCALLGIFAMFVISKIDYERYKKFVPAMMLSCVIMLVLVLVPGVGVKLNGSRRWLDTPFLQLQPSEFMKPVIAMFFAKLIDTGMYNMKKLKGNMPFVLSLGVVVFLMLCETHLSGAIVIAGIGICVMIASGTPIKPVIITMLIVVPIGLVAIKLFSDVRWARITSFIHPFEDIRDESYQVAQGLYAIGSGGIFGLGLGRSVQKYSYLPEPYNDFIFAIVCEELGLVGAAVVIILFAALVVRAVKIALNAPDTYSTLIAVGISAQLAIQTLLNIAVATSSVPNTGVALPFFSYGGTAIITILCEMGILLNISRRSIR